MEHPETTTVWLDVAETTRRLGASRPTICRLLRSGALRGWRLHDRGRWRIDPASVDEALARMRQACAR